MPYRFEFDPVNKILLFRFQGQLTDEALVESYRAIRKYWTATDASIGFWDFSAVTHFSVSSEYIRRLARQEPAMGEATTRPRFIIVPATVGFGLSRMFQLIGEHTRPLLNVVRTFDEALAAVNVPSSHFEPLD
jgi:hypothetical protein